MVKPLTIRLTIPLSDERLPPPIIFSKWLPLGDDHAIVVAGERFTLRFWINQACLSDRYDSAPLERWVNINVVRVHCDVIGLTVSDELADFVVEMSQEKDFTKEHLEAKSKSDLLVQ